MGGHYYAFVKAHDTGKWFCFNDSNVTGLDPYDIGKRTFGGSGSNCAYMLFYRKVDKEAETFQRWGG